jgi:hypothetical protein
MQRHRCGGFPGLPDRRDGYQRRLRPETGARIAASKTEHLVTCADQFRDDPGTDESCCTCHENAHRNLLYLFTARIGEKQPPD